MDSGNWWWTGRPGVLRFMVSQRAAHNWLTELNWKKNPKLQFSPILFIVLISVQFSRSVIADSLRPMDFSTPSFHVQPIPRASSNSCPLSRWCHPTILSSVVPFSSCLKSFPASGSFPVNQVFTSGGQSFGASISKSFLPMNIQDWFPLGLTGLISLLSKDSQESFFSNTTVQKHQFFSPQLSLWSSSHIHTWLLEKP